MVGITELIIVTFIPFLFIYLLNFLLPKKISENLKESGNKYASIEGLRGLSAILVIIHHSFISWGYFQIGIIWRKDSFIHMVDKTVPEKVVNALTLLGDIGVCFFFMITGFLFYDKLIKSKGKYDPYKFYIKRFFRIVPVYYFVILLVFITVFLTGLPKFESLKQEIYSFSSWLTFGILEIETISSLMSGSLLIAGVVWTLAIEWIFYTFIPVLSVFTKNKKTSILFVFIVFVGCFLTSCSYENFNSDITFPFAFGMLSSLFVNYYKSKIFDMKKSLFSVVALIFFWNIVFEDYYEISYIHYLIMGLFFILISNGNTIFGILSSKIFIMLGKISYSIYLVHGLVLFWINGVLMKNNNYLTNSVIATILTLTISVFTYYYIERTGINYGRKIIK